ncbi:unnamed protein product [Darwinula stevensoni]|uniref:CD109 antigen n=1 Tax=Darwinula stevensoni TaxID=69355 RepID=A0A7R8X9D3_9CRUS|nr:unnamed protein product [Darwinula stevensoni]CAG0890979.1 unnamed protein product [Darwinula stevensoni]
MNLSYLVIAPKVVRPGSVYGVAVALTRQMVSMSLRASLLKDGTELYQASEEINPGRQVQLLLKVPFTSVAGSYRLRVEGNVHGTTGGTVFVNETALEFSPRFLTILIQTNRPVYNGGQIVRFRVVLLTMSLKPFDDPVDIYVLDPNGFILRRWPSRQTSNGVLSLRFQLPEYPAVGDWVIQAVANGQVEQKNITVEKYFQRRFEVAVELPTFFLTTDEYVTGKVLSNYTNFREAPGNLTLRVYSRDTLRTGYHHFKLPMSDLSWRISRLDGAEIRVEATVGEHFLQMIEQGFSTARIINSSIALRFLGKSPFIFKPGMPILLHSAETDILGFPSHAMRNQYIHIFSSTQLGNIGEFAIFHVRSNFYMESFHYLVFSKDILLYAATETIRDVSIPSVATLSIPISSEMAPTFTVVVYHMAVSGEVLADSVMLPVNALNRQNVLLQVNQAKDHSGRTVELILQGEIGAHFCVSGLREGSYSLQSGHELSASSILQELSSFDERNRTVQRAVFRFRNGQSDESILLPTPNYGPDANRTFALSRLVVLSDHPLPSLLDPNRNFCNESLGYLQCLMGPCYLYIQKCDGHFDCPDRSDEADCDDFMDDLRDFRLQRNNRLWRFYDAEYGDWAWTEVKSVGNEIFPVQVPKRPEVWMMSVFAVGKEKGLSIMQHPIRFHGTTPFLITAEAPKVCRQGEQVGIRVAVFNHLLIETEALVTLHHSFKYKFVHVEKGGVIPPQTSMDIYFPIVPTVKEEIQVFISGITQVGQDTETVNITVLAEGCPSRNHTSVMLDLKNRATVFQFLDIVVEESPLIKYQNWRRYIYGTPKATISIFGDVVAPAFPQIPMNVEAAFPIYHWLSADSSVYDFGSNLWTLHYLRLTNQLKLSTSKKVFEFMSVYYAAIMNYRNHNGSFSMLTSHIVQTLYAGVFQDWENFLYIDPEVISSAVEWLLDHQTLDGSFHETPEYETPLDLNMVPGRWNQNISLTAHVLITLAQTLEALPGEVRGRAANGKRQATHYLELHLSSVHDTYELAILTYALSIANSGEKELAFRKLDAIKIEQDGLIYWASEPIYLYKYKYENNRPFIQAKDPSPWDTNAVGATAYALLVYLAREGVTVIQERIVEWFQLMRKFDSAFGSTADTLVALQALTEYSFRARLRDITDMTVKFEASASNFSKSVTLGPNGLSKLQIFDLENVWGQVNVIGKGAGQAVVQLDVTWGVDWPNEIQKPLEKAFDLQVYTAYSGRNSSHMHVKACTRWVGSYAENSGVAVVQIDTPTGYKILQPDLIKYVDSQLVPKLKWAYAADEGTSFYFYSYIEIMFCWFQLNRTETCFNYTIQRWYPVANMSRYLSARAYELYAPERFNLTVVEMIDLYSLHVCAVCGSFQCPYCPTYSSAPRLVEHQPWLLSCVILLAIVNLPADDVNPSER